MFSSVRDAIVKKDEHLCCRLKAELYHSVKALRLWVSDMKRNAFCRFLPCWNASCKKPNVFPQCYRIDQMTYRECFWRTEKVIKDVYLPLYKLNHYTNNLSNYQLIANFQFNEAEVIVNSKYVFPLLFFCLNQLLEQTFGNTE